MNCTIGHKLTTEQFYFSFAKANRKFYVTSYHTYLILLDN